MQVAAHGALAHQAHVHGHATIQVSIAGDKLSITLNTPLDNLLGFETAPANASQGRAVDAMAVRLRRSESVAAPSAGAGCVAGPVRLNAPVLAGTPGHDAPRGTTPPANEEHANMEAAYTFTCGRPEALREIEVRLFGELPRLKRIDVQVAGPRGQASQRLTPKNRIVRL
ncbi:MAG: DUF2796 domain-containing protein [Candidatus Methylacidiphilales bacterium]|nr:DUF2796 domain-containing protein [Candidatus Methylacidiphilales bacterium]